MGMTDTVSRTMHLTRLRAIRRKIKVAGYDRASGRSPAESALMASQLLENATGRAYRHKTKFYAEDYYAAIGMFLEDHPLPSSVFRAWWMNIDEAARDALGEYAPTQYGAEARA